MIGYKILTENNFSPIIRSSNPVLPVGFTLPYTLPKVKLDMSDAECGEGWNFSKTIKEAFDICRIVGRYGIHNIYKVEGSADSIIRGNKIRCSQLTILDRISSEELEEPNDKNKELFEWLYLKRETESKEIIKEEFLKTLEIKKLKFDVEFFTLDNFNDYYKNYYNYYNCNNFYNNNYAYYKDYYYYYRYRYYYYIIESFFESNIAFRKSLIKAYKYGMRKIKFIEKEMKILIFTKTNLPSFDD